MTISRDQKFALAKLRQGAPANLKMSISRPARRKNMIGIRQHQGTGNVQSYVQGIVSEIGATLTKDELSYLTAKVNRAYDASGRIPGAFEINEMIGD